MNNKYLIDRQLRKLAAMPFVHLMKNFYGKIPNLRALTPSLAWKHALKNNPVDIDFMKTPGAIRRSALLAAALLAIANNSYMKRMPEQPITLYKGGMMGWPSVRSPRTDEMVDLDGYTKGMLFGVVGKGMVDVDKRIIDDRGFSLFVKRNPNATAADTYRALYLNPDDLVSIDGRKLKPWQISSYLGYRDFHNAMRKTKAFKLYMRITQPKKFPFRRFFQELPVTALGQLAKRLLVSARNDIFPDLHSSVTNR